MAIQDLNACLDLKQNLNIVAACKQFDNLNLILNIFDNSMQADLTNYDVRLRAMKADQVPLIQEHVGITLNGNLANIKADNQLTTTAGNTFVELQFINKSTGEKKATFNLALKVVPSTVNINGTISTATYTLLEELENKIDQCSDFFEHIGEAIEANTNLINSTNAANETKEVLDDSNTTALATKSAVDTSNANATNTKNALDTLNTTANSTKDNLNVVNQTGQNLLSSLETFEQEHADVTNISNQLANINADLSEGMKQIDNLNTNKADKTEINNLASGKANQSDLNLANNKITQNANDIATQNARIDSFTSLASGSTTGDAELIDGRIGADAITYNNIGSAVRTQLNTLKTKINTLNTGESLIDFSWKNGVIYSTGLFNDTSKKGLRTTSFIRLSDNTTLTINIPTNYQLTIWEWIDTTQNATVANTYTGTSEITLTNIRYYHLCIQKIDGSDIALYELYNLTFKSESTILKKINENTDELNNVSSLLTDNKKEMQLEWVYGGIHGATGVFNYNEINRIVTKQISVDDTIDVKITIPENHTLEVWVYNKSDNSYKTANDYTTGTISMSFNENYVYYLVLYVTAKKDTATYTFPISESENVHIEYNNELSANFKDLNSRISSIENAVYDDIAEIKLEWKNGKVYGNGLIDDTSTTYLRTVDFYSPNEDERLKIVIPSGYNVGCWKWSNTTQNALKATTLVNESQIILLKGYYYLFTFSSNTSSIVVSESDSENIQLLKVNKQEGYGTFFEDKEDEVYDRVKNVISETDIIFGLITDEHVDLINDNLYNHPNALNKLCERLGADFTINLGDVFSNTTHEEDLEKMMKYFSHARNTFIPAMYCKGNHENFPIQQSNGVYENALTEQQIKRVGNYDNKYIIKSTDNMYYYFDKCNIRFIVLDSSSNTNDGFSDAHMSFLQDAFNTIGTRKAIIFTHLPLDASLMTEATPINSSAIRSILISNKSKIIAVMHGHTHWDNVAKLDDITYISTCCAVPWKADISTYTGGLGSPTSYDRAYGEYSEYCFDIVCVDITNNIIRTFRFGVGSDRTIQC